MAGQTEDDYRRGFEHAIRNIVKALEKQAHEETQSDRRLGLQVAIDTVRSYHGFLD